MHLLCRLFIKLPDLVLEAGDPFHVGIPGYRNASFDVVDCCGVVYCLDSPFCIAA